MTPPFINAFFFASTKHLQILLMQGHFSSSSRLEFLESPKSLCGRPGFLRVHPHSEDVSTCKNVGYQAPSLRQKAELTFYSPSSHTPHEASKPQLSFKAVSPRLANALG